MIQQSEEIIIKSENELENAAVRLLSFSGDQKILAFYGQMGAGKTTFIRRICQVLGVRENVSSPTFSLINEYTDAKGNPVYHFDFYRINKEQEAIDIGCEEYFESGNLCLVEWPEKILNLLPQPHIGIRIHLNNSHRILNFSHD